MTTRDEDGDSIPELMVAHADPFERDKPLSTRVFARVVSGESGAELRRFGFAEDDAVMPEGMRVVLGKGDEGVLPIGDVDGDAVADVVVCFEADTPGREQVPGSGRVVVLSGATGAVVLSLELPGSGRVRLLGPFEDLDADGTVDFGLLVSRWVNDPEREARLVSGSSGETLCRWKPTIDGKPLRVHEMARLGDLDGDGRPELLLSGFDSTLGVVLVASYDSSGS